VDERQEGRAATLEARPDFPPMVYYVHCAREVNRRRAAASVIKMDRVRPQPRWKRVLDVALALVALYRVVIAYTVDVAMTFKYPLALDGCAAACAGRFCALNCRLRAALHLDLREYLASGIDPVSSALRMPIRIMTGFYFVCFAPFLVVLVYSLWKRREAIRVPAIAMGAITAGFMTALIIQTAFGDPPSTNLGLFLAYNAIDVAAPVLILARTVPRPLFA
jgi:EXPERA (EXPanded EBP superfamily)